MVSPDKNIKQEKYNPGLIEKKWQEEWEKEGIYSPDLGKSKKPFYNLMMFPYPSAEGLHAGNMYAFTGADIRGRFMRMQGFDVFEPIGLDGFGIHSENYALKVGRHPKEQAKISEKNFYRQLHEIGNSYDWKRKVETYDPNYYKWTQWLFIQMFKKGLAYRKKAKVNYCPSCKTVLSDEQVIKKETDKAVLNVCERCSFAVEKKELEQWFFRITKYAEKLLSNLNKLDWSEKVKIAQKNWIGRSEGVRIKFEVPHFAKASRGKQNSEFKIEVFTTRPDTLFGATFLVVSPEHEVVNEILNQVQNDKIKKEIQDYIEKTKTKSEIERTAEGKEKTGVFTGTYAINSANGEEIPIWIADYVLMTYGTGAIMAVPAHDKRDFEFAKKFGIKIKEVIIPVTASSSEAVSSEIVASASGETRNDEESEPYAGEGEIINSEDWNGWKTSESIHKVIAWLEEKNIGRKEIHYHLRDWLISRQRYWGPPIPMIYCEKCKWNPVKEEDLPVLLPDVKDWRPEGTHSTSSGQAVKSPLANHPEFYQTTCPVCGGKARRETDVSDTFLDSSWYFFRYISTEFDDVIFDKERAKKWLPVDMYIGGAEHSVLHLLYARFITMFIKDLGLISFEEPFKRFFAHGLLIKEGAKMSKSKGNVIVPDAYIKKFGADTMRCYLMFLGPYSQGGDFYDTGIEGVNRFLKRVWTLFGQIKITDKEEDSESIRAINKTIKGVTRDIEEFSYNTAIAKLMEFYNFISDKKFAGKDTMISFLKLLAPFAPHIAEELFNNVILSETKDLDSSLLRAQNDKVFKSIHKEEWPKYDEKFLVEDEVVIVVQVNGKVRDSIKVRSEKLEVRSEIEELARESGKVQRYLEGKTVKKVIYVAGKIINFVTS